MTLPFRFAHPARNQNQTSLPYSFNAEADETERITGRWMINFAGNQLQIRCCSMIDEGICCEDRLLKRRWRSKYGVDLAAVLGIPFCNNSSYARYFQAFIRTSQWKMEHSTLFECILRTGQWQRQRGRWSAWRICPRSKWSRQPLTGGLLRTPSCNLCSNWHFHRVKLQRPFRANGVITKPTE